MAGGGRGRSEFRSGLCFYRVQQHRSCGSKTAREKAKLLAAKASPGERLLDPVDHSVKENNFIAGISAMNDMLEMFPKDKRLAYLAGGWLMGQNSYEQAQKPAERRWPSTRIIRRR